MQKKIGEIELNEIAMLSDPCYGYVNNPNSTIKVVSGKYNIYVTYSESKDIGYEGRITNLIAIHQDYAKRYNKLPKNDKEYLSCVVDSGTCGIFDLNYYKQNHSEDDVNDEWYAVNVIGMGDYNITDEKGAISSSGWGDGTYDAFAEYDKENKAYAIRISFL
jgi:hypothetical protein